MKLVLLMTMGLLMSLPAFSFHSKDVSCYSHYDLKYKKTIANFVLPSRYITDEAHGHSPIITIIIKSKTMSCSDLVFKTDKNSYQYKILVKGTGEVVNSGFLLKEKKESLLPKAEEKQSQYECGMYRSAPVDEVVAMNGLWLYFNGKTYDIHLTQYDCEDLIFDNDGVNIWASEKANPHIMVWRSEL